jgi:hypothetical protein
MPTENEPITAERMRQKKFVAILGQCLDCGEPVIETQEFLRTEDGIRHALCFFDTAFAKHMRELKAKTKQ